MAVGPRLFKKFLRLSDSLNFKDDTLKYKYRNLGLRPVLFNDLIKEDDQGYEQSEARRVAFLWCRNSHGIIVMEQDWPSRGNSQQSVNGVEALEDPPRNALVGGGIRLLGFSENIEVNAKGMSRADEFEEKRNWLESFGGL